MSGDLEKDTRVLIVDDEKRAVDSYASVLSREYDVLTAYGGNEALSILKEEDGNVDVVLLDRRMPEVSGDEVLKEIQRRKYDCRVAMVTAVNPDFDILELGIDDYIVKPVGKDGLHTTVERLLMLDEYDETFSELSGLKIKRNVLKIEKSDAVLAESEEFAELEERIESLTDQLDDMKDALEQMEAKLDHPGRYRH